MAVHEDQFVLFFGQLKHFRAVSSQEAPDAELLQGGAHRQMGLLERGHALLRNSSDESFLIDVRTTLLPMFEGSTSTEQLEVLCAVFAEKSLSSLSICSSLIEAPAKLSLIETPSDAVAIFVACAYACTEPSQLLVMANLHETLIPDVAGLPIEPVILVV